MAYELNISIDSQGLQTLLMADQVVIVARSYSANPFSPVMVAWQAFQPLESNTVSWADDYQVFATEAQPMIGAEIQMMAEAPIQPGSSCTFANGNFEVSGGGSDPQGAEIYNQGNMRCGFGLAQAGAVNGQQSVAPIGMVELLNGQSGTFTPYQAVTVFTGMSVPNGTFIQMPGNPLTVELSPSNPTATIVYNDATNSFEPLSSSMAMDGPTLQA